MSRGMSIRLHKEKGLNPRLGICPNCGKENGEIALLGSQNTKYRCGKCGATTVGGSRSPARCSVCKTTKGTMTKLGELEDSEKIVGGLCKACEEKQKSVNEEVRRGGVFWRCADCHSEGALKAEHPFSRAVREAHKLTNGEPCGVEFTKKDCPLCSQQAGGQA